MEKFPKLAIPNADEDAEEQELLIHCWWEWKMAQLL